MTIFEFGASDGVFGIKKGTPIIPCYCSIPAIKHQMFPIDYHNFSTSQFWCMRNHREETTHSWLFVLDKSIKALVIDGKIHKFVPLEPQENNLIGFLVDTHFLWRMRLDGAEWIFAKNYYDIA